MKTYASVRDTVLSLSTAQGITLSNDMVLALEGMKKCRTVKNGGRILFCPHCKAHIVLYNPCNKRGCPVCATKNHLAWQNKTLKRILPTTHYHLTFSIPEYYTPLWLKNKKIVADCLFKAVSTAIDELGKAAGLLIGSILVFQSHARGMAYKPHIHCVLSAGGLDKTDTWQNLQNLPLRLLEETTKTTFEEEIVQKLGHCIVLNDTARYRVFVQIHENTGAHIVQYLSKTRTGVVLDPEQELLIDDDVVEFFEEHNGEQRTTRLSQKVFLERYLNHIPVKGSVTARYYGLYANRHKQEYAKAYEQLSQEKQEHLEPYVEKCPECNSELTLVLKFKKNETPDFETYGFNRGPPNHADFKAIA